MNEQLIIPVLSAMAVVAVGAAILLARWARRAPVQARIRNLTDASSVRVQSEPTGGPKLTDVVGNIGSAVASKGPSLSLRQQLTQAGYHQPRAAAVYVGAKLMLFTTGVLVAAALVIPAQMGMQSKLLIIAAKAIILFFIPNMVVAYRRSNRSTEIRRHLPDAIDLLEICASAGMGLDMAWNSVAEEVRSVSPMLADEMALTNLEIHLGASRAEAMRHMSHRTGADELSSLVAVLVQSERFGTSISDALRTYATSMRETRSVHSQESAEKLGVKLIFPMVLFIFPAVVMVMAGPGFISLYRALRAH